MDNGAGAVDRRVEAKQAITIPHLRNMRLGTEKT